MKKINTILAAVGALLMLTVTGANSAEFKLGVSANGMAAYANAKETLKDSGRVSNEEAVLATTFASVFAEVSSDEAMGLGSGISYAPEVADLSKETRAVNQCTPVTGRNTGIACANKTGSSADSGNQIVDGKIKKYLSEVTLINQDWVLEPSLTLAQVLKDFNGNHNDNLSIVDFKLLILGEGIEVEEKSFSEEVASQVNNTT